MLGNLASYDGPLSGFAEGMQELKLPRYTTRANPRQDSHVVKFPQPGGYILKQYNDSKAAKLQFLAMNLLAERLPEVPYAVDGTSAQVAAVHHHALVKTPKGLVAVIEQAAGNSLYDIAGDVMFRREQDFTDEDRKRYLHSVPLLARMVVDDTFGKVTGNLLVDDIATPHDRPGPIMVQNIFVDHAAENDVLGITIIDQPRLGHSLDRLKAQAGLRLLGEMSAA